MDTALKHKLGTTIAIDKREVLDYFSVYINNQMEDSKNESYLCKDYSFLILQQSAIKGKVFVKFHLNFLIDASQKTMSFEGKNWFIRFCKTYNSEIQNLRTGVVMPASDGAIMSDIFTSEAFRRAKHRSQHPKDLRNKNKMNR
ncbi:hypothetical protein U6A24_09780 [Aquimarina gracilis]|uniref:Uncharacterized protein n=1 Tax=Aquimarina gracilis TaxID=874422 RepID=A0ABU5ZVK8_9FLAO|nr:hypothetical protein [Aquimarina gracilis]MEB3345751.1 hypothetical protein [Aquimarina gracilis]